MNEELLSLELLEYADHINATHTAVWGCVDVKVDDIVHEALIMVLHEPMRDAISRDIIDICTT